MNIAQRVVWIQKSVYHSMAFFSQIVSEDQGIYLYGPLNVIRHSALASKELSRCRKYSQETRNLKKGICVEMRNIETKAIKKVKWKSKTILKKDEERVAIMS